jgi:mono/diheme cytochrome c family protein
MGRGFIVAKAAAALIGGLMALVAGAQTPSGSYSAGEALWNANGCSGCHTLAKARGDITMRAPAGMTFAKALAALTSALGGKDLDNNATGMESFAPSLSATNRNDLAAYISNTADPAPILSYSPTGGGIFAATAVGATSSATVTMRNTGTAPLTFATNNAVTIASGGDAADFRITASSCPGATLMPNGNTCTINVSFTPAAGASLTRSAAIGLATTTSTSLVPLTGSVSVAAAPPSSAANPPSSGGGGALPWQLLLVAVAASSAAVRFRTGR